MLLASAAAGVAARAAEAQPQWTIFVCVDTRGGLQQAAREYQARLERVSRQRAFPLAVQRIVQDAPDAGLTEQLLVFDNDRWRTARSGPVGALAPAVGDAAWTFFRQHPARQRMVLIVGHGAGLLESQAMEPEALGTALSAPGGDAPPIDVLGLDTCYGASLEKLWALRGCCRYIVAAPGLVYSPGLRWDEALSEPAGDEARTLAKSVTQLGMSRGTQDAALVSIETAQLEGVRLRVAELVDMLVPQMAEMGPTIIFTRSRVASWGKRRELCDLAAFAAGLAANVGGGELAERALALRKALAAATVAQWMPGDSVENGGPSVGIYFPPTVERLPAAYEAVPFAEDSGWRRFLGQYWAWVSSLVAGDAHPGQ